MAVNQNFNNFNETIALGCRVWKTKIKTEDGSEVSICGKSEGLADASDFFVEGEDRIYFTMNL